MGILYTVIREESGQPIHVGPSVNVSCHSSHVLPLVSSWKAVQIKLGIEIPSKENGCLGKALSFTQLELKLKRDGSIMPTTA
jgi:hypothetical protein